MQCAACGAETRNPKYCSVACQKSREWQDRRQVILAGGIVPNGSRRSARRYVEELQGRCCKLCGNMLWQGQPIPLLLDHINGNSADWRIDNLRLICPNCDAQLPTFKSRNRGQGRAWPRKRYADGLSY